MTFINFMGTMLVTAALMALAQRAAPFPPDQLAYFGIALWGSLLLMVHDRKGDSDE